MTIKEFIYAFDEDSLYAEYDEQGNVYIYDNTYDLMMARLESESSVWEVEDDTFTMSPSLLRLMAELAETPAKERAEANKEWKEALKLINCFDSIGYTLAGILFESYFGKGNKYSAQLFKLHDDLIHMKGEFRDQLKRECPDVFLADLFDGGDDHDHME